MSRKRSNATMSLFDLNDPIVSAPQEPPKLEPNSCPKCGRKSLVSTRAMEYGGRDRYCAACPGDEPGEPLRWKSSEGVPF